MPFTLDGQALALWVTPEGHPVAHEDRCAHQGVELSDGICSRGTLICPAHGWTFDPDGTARPPGARNWKPPPQGWMKIMSYRATDHLGFLWVALEEPAVGLPGEDGAAEGVALAAAGDAEPLLTKVRDVLARLHPGIEGERQGASLVLRGGGIDQLVVTATPTAAETTRLCLALRGGSVDALASELQRSIA